MRVSGPNVAPLSLSWARLATRLRWQLRCLSESQQDAIVKVEHLMMTRPQLWIAEQDDRQSYGPGRIYSMAPVDQSLSIGFVVPLCPQQDDLEQLQSGRMSLQWYCRLYDDTSKVLFPRFLCATSFYTLKTGRIAEGSRMVESGDTIVYPPGLAGCHHDLALQALIRAGWLV